MTTKRRRRPALAASSAAPPVPRLPLDALLADYARVSAALDAIRGDSPDASRPMPPASAAALDAYAERLGGALPPSYRAFLERHDGWAEFWGATWIAGAAGEARRYVDEQLASRKRYDRRLGSLDHPDIEIEGRRYAVIGGNDNGGFLALGDVAGPDGERAVLDLPRGFVENEWPSFLDFLHQQYGCRLRALERERMRRQSPVY
jgi:hypothetical protein